MTQAKTTNYRFSTAYRKASLAERFRMSYTVNSENGCWEWHGFIVKVTGYGLICSNRHRLQAHRVAYERHKGPINNLCVLHKCDNRKCVNPDHLFLGTRSDNNRDRDLKGRGQHGERHYSAKLKETDIPILIERYQEGNSITELAREYSVNYGTMYQVVNKQTWKYLHKEN